MALIDSFVTDISSVRTILRSGRAGTGRTIREYLRLRAKYIGLVRILGRRLKDERIFGVRMAAGEYSNLVFLFSETFVNDEYGFASPDESPTILDCGANIGMATLYFKTLYPKARITAFEPAPATFKCLSRNTAAFQDVEVRNQAIAGRAGHIDLFREDDHPTSPMASTSQGRVDGAHISVEAVTLSEVISGPIDFLKVDIEGAELEAMEELEASGKLPLVAQMAIEFHHHVNKDDDRFSRLLNLLERNGFGYQLRAPLAALYRPGSFQDVLVYAYRRTDPQRTAP
jgi:FkbM family methyltransferase